MGAIYIRGAYGRHFLIRELTTDADPDSAIDLDDIPLPPARPP